MHFVIFEGLSEEKRQTAGGVDLCGDADLKAVQAQDTVWVVTRMGHNRLVPALCGRLIADRVVPHSLQSSGFDAAHSDSLYQLVLDQTRSERCIPFACDMIASWDIWRRPFRGVRMLTDDQGRTLEAAWTGHVREPRPAR